MLEIGDRVKTPSGRTGTIIAWRQTATAWRKDIMARLTLDGLHQSNQRAFDLAMLETKRDWDGALLFYTDCLVKLED